MNPLRLALAAGLLAAGCMSVPAPHPRALECNELCAQYIAMGNLSLKLLPANLVTLGMAGGIGGAVGLLIQRGAILTYSDPHIPRLPEVRHHHLPAMVSQQLTPEFLASQDCLLIATDHTDFDYDSIVAHGHMILDTRNATKGVVDGREKIRRA